MTESLSLREELTTYRELCDESLSSVPELHRVAGILAGEMQDLSIELDQADSRLARHIGVTAALLLRAGLLALSESKNAYEKDTDAVLAPYRAIAALLRPRIGAAVAHLQEMIRLDAEIHIARYQLVSGEARGRLRKWEGQRLATGEYSELRREVERALEESAATLEAVAGSASELAAGRIQAWRTLLIRLQNSLIHDVEALETADISRIERKYRLLGALITAAPNVIGFGLDQWLARHGGPAVGTPLGIVATFAEQVLLAPERETSKSEEIARHLASGTVLLSFVVIPHLVTQLASLEAHAMQIAEGWADDDAAQ